MSRESELVLAALREWYDAQRERGTSPADLPDVEDLKLVAGTAGMSRQLLGTLAFRNPDAMQRYATGVIAAVRQGQRAAAELPDEPAPAPAQAAVVEPAAAEPEPEAKAAPKRRRSTTRTQEAASEAPARQPASASFARYDPSIAGQQRPEGSLQVEAVPGRPTSLTWTQLSGESVVIYRVVSRDDQWPWSPDEEDGTVEVGSTTTQAFLDPRPVPESPRYYQVWAHTGHTEAEARADQPTLLAERVALGPPAQVEWHEQDSSLYVSWRLAPDVHGARLERFELDVHGRPGPFSDELPVAPGQSEYQDGTGFPGRSYEYWLRAVFVDEQRGMNVLSEPNAYRVSYREILEPVTDLHASESSYGGRRAIDLQWTRPGGAEVRIYRTAQPPEPGVGDESIPLERLADVGLPEDARQRSQVEGDGALATMRAITWPEELARVFLVPVTVSGDHGRIGTFATLSRTVGVKDSKLEERVTHQQLTFAWPKGAASVSIYRTEPEVSYHDGPAELMQNVTKGQYDRDGCVRLERLPWTGCALHLVATSFYAGTQHVSDAHTLHYPGVFRVDCWMNDTPGLDGGLERRIELYREPHPRLRAPEAAIEVTVHLVVNRDRLPLWRGDGHPLGALAVQVPVEGGGATPVGPPLQAETLHGYYVRAFGELPEGVPYRLAFMDPPARMMRP
jgi:hypothetical protein